MGVAWGKVTIGGGGYDTLAGGDPALTAGIGNNTYGMRLTLRASIRHP